MTITRSCVALVVLVLAASPAWAEGGGDPGDAVQEVDGPRPKIISSGKSAEGQVFLAVTPKGPMVFMKTTDGDLAELDVLSMNRVKGGFHVDTLDEGEFIFETGRPQKLVNGTVRKPRVIKPGIPGFNSPQPTVVFGEDVDPGVLDDVRRKLGSSTPKAAVPVDRTEVAVVRFPQGDSAVMSPGQQRGVVARSATAARARLRGRNTIRGKARRGAR